MKLKLHSKLVLTFTDTSETIVSGAFRVIGIYQSDNAPLDERNVYLEMKDLNTLLGTDKSFQEIALLLKNDGDVNLIQQNLIKRYPDLLIESWKDVSPETDLLVKTVNQYSYIIMIIGYYNIRGLNLSGMGKEMMSSFGFGTLIYPEFPGEKLAGVLLIVVSTALVSCIIPAVKAKYNLFVLNA